MKYIVFLETKDDHLLLCVISLFKRNKGQKEQINIQDYVY